MAIQAVLIVVVTPDMQFLKWEEEKVPSKEYGGLLGAGCSIDSEQVGEGAAMQREKIQEKNSLQLRSFLGVFQFWHRQKPLSCSEAAWCKTAIQESPAVQ